MIVGIDLGTTNSLVAVWKDGAPHLIPNALGEYLTPSVVGLDDDGQILVGRAARERLQTHPHLTAGVFKRYMGSEHTVSLGNKTFRPEELSSLVLRSLEAEAEAWLGEKVTEAVITVPAYFNDRQRKATQIAGRLAGLKVERLLNEPTAAALAYGLHKKDLESKFLVSDLGGGTFDVSLLELFEGVMEVRATAGDNFLGGEDFVEALVLQFIEKVGAQAGLSSKDVEGKLASALRSAAERAKRSLSEAYTATMKVVWNGRELSWTIDEEQFLILLQGLFDRLTAPVERTLRDASIRSAELDEILLVGGATRMPSVRKFVAKMFGRFPTTDLNPDETVALAAAVQAGLKTRDQALREVVMTDVCPYTLGIEVVKPYDRDDYQPGHFSPILDRNIVIPASRVSSFRTIKDLQAQILINVYQGESRKVKSNVFLGSLQIAVPPRPAGEESVEVRFTYDINGLLEIEARSVSTGEVKRVIIEQSPGVMSPEEIARRLKELAKLKIHPRDQAENKAVLTRAERLYEQLLGESRELLSDRITAFESAVDGQDPKEIEVSRKRLSQLLDQLEGDSYF